MTLALNNSWGSSRPKSTIFRILGITIAIDVAFVLVNVSAFIVLGEVHVLFDVNAEANFPTWWSSFQLALAGVAVSLVFLANRDLPRMGGLALLAAVLVLMSLDETSSLHERVGFQIDKIAGDRRETMFSYTGLWFLVVGIPFAIWAVVTLFRMSFFLSRVPSVLLLFGAGFASLVFGAVGLEGMSNFGAEDSLAFWSATWAEEFFEMVGGSLLLAGAAILLLYDERTGPGLRAVVAE